MMNVPMVDELRQEAGTTRRVLERVPGDKLSWRPHPTSMTLGQLAIHIATIPGAICGLAALDGFDASTVGLYAAPAGVARRGPDGVRGQPQECRGLPLGADSRLRP